MPRSSIVIPLLLSGAILATGLFAGPLNPPAGPVTSTYKTLNEVEPRTPIGSATTPGTATSTFRISQPGSYYLTGNVTGESGKIGIEIAASGVTIDLRGFEVAGVAGSLDGIATAVVDLHSIAVSNGTLRSWGGDGIDLFTNLSNGGVLRDIRAAANTGAGIRTGRGGTVSHCTATSNTIDGIVTGSGCVISDCAAISNSGSGISVGVECFISSCASRLNGLDGILATGGCQIINNSSGSNGQAAATGANIHVTGADNRIEGNNCTSADRGIEASTSGNFIVRNTCSGNAINWVLAANNIYGPILDRSASAAVAVSGSTGVGNLGTTDPNANFTY